MRACGRSCETGEVVTFALTGGQITGSSVGAAEADIGGPDVWMSPGFLDLQVNGYGGYDFNSGAWRDSSVVRDEIAPMVDLLAQHGTPLFCPTICTNSGEGIRA